MGDMGDTTKELFTDYYTCIHFLLHHICYNNNVEKSGALTNLFVQYYARIFNHIVATANGTRMFTESVVGGEPVSAQRGNARLPCPALPCPGLT